MWLRYVYIKTLRKYCVFRWSDFQLIFFFMATYSWVMSCLTDSLLDMQITYSIFCYNRTASFLQPVPWEGLTSARWLSRALPTALPSSLLSRSPLWHMCLDAPPPPPGPWPDQAWPCTFLLFRHLSSWIGTCFQCKPPSPLEDSPESPGKGSGALCVSYVPWPNKNLFCWVLPGLPLGWESPSQHRASILLLSQETPGEWAPWGGIRGPHPHGGVKCTWTPRRSQAGWESWSGVQKPGEDRIIAGQEERGGRDHWWEIEGIPGETERRGKVWQAVSWGV